MESQVCVCCLGKINNINEVKFDEKLMYHQTCWEKLAKPKINFSNQTNNKNNHVKESAIFITNKLIKLLEEGFSNENINKNYESASQIYNSQTPGFDYTSLISLNDYKQIGKIIQELFVQNPDIIYNFMTGQTKLNDKIIFEAKEQFLNIMSPEAFNLIKEIFELKFIEGIQNFIFTNNQNVESDFELEQVEGYKKSW